MGEIVALFQPYCKWIHVHVSTYYILRMTYHSIMVHVLVNIPGTLAIIMTSYIAWVYSTSYIEIDFFFSQHKTDFCYVHYIKPLNGSNNKRVFKPGLVSVAH